MGLGKTVQAIAAMVSLRNTGDDHFMVVCPASVVENWCREVEKHSKLRAFKVHGPDRSRAISRWSTAGGVAVTTYKTLASTVIPNRHPIHMLVVDEAHCAKNPEAARTKNVRLLCARTKRVLFMTGTALENKVDEMISLVSILRPSLVSQLTPLAHMSSAAVFREKTAPVYYRRRRKDVLAELPELIESNEWCQMGPEETSIYEQAVLGRKYADARRVSWSVPDLSKSCKARRLREIVEEAEGDGRKVIVFSFFLDTIAKIRQHLGERCTEPINGSVPPQRRQLIIDEFGRAAPGSVLVAQIQAGGTGLNIQSASVVVICKPQFKPSIENQAISRAYRMGQSRNVLVYRLLCPESVDEKMTTILEKKQREFDAFADESVAAREAAELDEKTFGNIIEEEVERIKRRHAAEGNAR